MDVSRWRRIEDVFTQASQVAAGEARDTLLAGLCGGDDTLRTDVVALLSEDDRLQAAPAPADQHLGLRLGSYEIESLIARGGMASVYEARRADAQFDQRVAIKIMDVRLSDPALLAQFRAERQILAALEHPNITRLIDGGVTPLGEPYLVMERVEGERLDQYCDRRRLTIDDRIRLFLEVTTGVDVAHRNLILHRDLKPANIMVTRDGRAKLLDFGTARLLPPDREATLTAAPLTPAFASPEQLTGEPVGTPSDEYSLGVILYELLSGSAAFPDRTSLIASMERAMNALAPDAPHQVVTEDAALARGTSIGRLRRQLAGDIGTVVLKALAHRPSDRYGSVQRFADDLERALTGQAILGRAPSVGYRVSRFVGRNRVAVSLASALAVALVSGVFLTVRQAATVRVEAEKAQQLNRFLTQMLSSANPNWSNANARGAGSITVREALDGAAQRVSIDLGATPAVEAEMQRTLGRTYLGLGAADQARPHLERALTLFRDAGDEFGVAFSTELLGQQYLLKGDYRRAEALFREALAYVRRRGDAVDPELHLMTTNDLGIALAYNQSIGEEILSLLREAIAVGDRSGLSPAGVSVGVANLGVQLLRVGRLAEAAATLRDALDRMNRMPSPPPERFLVFRNLSLLEMTYGRYDSAVRMLEEAVAETDKTLPSNHPYLLPLRMTLGRALIQAGHLPRGRAMLEECLAAYTRTRPPGHIDLAPALTALGQAHRLANEAASAERLLRESLAILRKNPTAQDRLADACGELGLALQATGRTPEARTLLAESHTLYRALWGDDHPSTRRAANRLKDAR